MPTESRARPQVHSFLFRCIPNTELKWGPFPWQLWLKITTQLLQLLVQATQRAISHFGICAANYCYFITHFPFQAISSTQDETYCSQTQRPSGGTTISSFCRKHPPPPHFGRQPGITSRGIHCGYTHTAESASSPQGPSRRGRIPATTAWKQLNQRHNFYKSYLVNSLQGGGTGWSPCCRSICSPSSLDSSPISMPWWKQLWLEITANWAPSKNGGQRLLSPRQWGGGY